MSIVLVKSVPSSELFVSWDAQPQSLGELGPVSLLLKSYDQNPNWIPCDLRLDQQNTHFTKASMMASFIF